MRLRLGRPDLSVHDEYVDVPAAAPDGLRVTWLGVSTVLVDDGVSAVLTDGPESRICGKVAVATYPVEQRLGLVWLYLPRGDEEPHPIDEQLPEELVGNDFVVGGRIDDRAGNWRFAVENGYDEGHAKYLHRTALWRLFKTMPAWNVTHIERRGRWIYRVQDEVHWSGDFPGVGTWTNYRWWKQRPPEGTFTIGNTGAAKRVDPPLAEADRRRVAEAVADVGDERVRAALDRLGRAVIGAGRRG